MTTAFDITFSKLGRRELARVLAQEPVPAGGKARSIVTANLDHIVQLRHRPDFRAAYKNAWAATIDGMPVHVYAKLRNTDVAERVTGSDLFADLMPLMDPRRHRCVFAASNCDTAKSLKQYLIGRGFDPSSILAIVPQYGFEKDAERSEAIARQIRDHNPTHVFFGIGGPKTEVWAHRYRDRLGDCYVLHIGAALEFFIGAKQRAPLWMRKSGMEWSWRLAQEPRRLFARYLIHSWGFVGAIRDDLSTSRHF